MVRTGGLDAASIFRQLNEFSRAHSFTFNECLERSGQRGTGQIRGKDLTGIGIADARSLRSEAFEGDAVDVYVRIEGEFLSHQCIYECVPGRIRQPVNSLGAKEGQVR